MRTVPLVAICFLISLAASLLWTVWSLRRRLSHSQAQLSLVLDHMKEGVVVLNPDRTIALMNTVSTRLISVPGEGRSYDLVEQQFDAISPEGEVLPTDQWPSARALRGDFVKNYRLGYRNKLTGETGSREMTSAPVPPGAGRPGQVIISYRDDSERQRIDLVRLRLAAIVESSSDAIISVAKGGVVTTWNKGAEKLLGYTAAEMIGQHIKRILPVDVPAAETELLRRILAGETEEHFESDRITKDGRTLRVDVTISPLRDPDGTLIGASTILRDITETRSLQRQLQQSQKMEAIGQLTGGVAHDFNNLLGIVIGNLEILATSLAGDPASLQRVHTAQKASNRCADLTRRLLAFSSNQPLQPVATRLEESVKNTLALAGRALGSDIELTTNFAGHLAPVFADPASLESAILNLVLNARDAMPGGGSLQITTKSVTIDAESPDAISGRLTPGRYAVVAVSDNGTGMSKETQDRAFEPFFTTKERGSGTGLGLPIVYGFARQSGGCVTIYSEPGCGTTVSLYLPFATQVAEPVPAAPEIAAARPAGTILLVDDEEDLLDLANIFLTRDGYKIITATSPAQALSLIHPSADIDLLLTDIIMPGGMNGVELADTVRQMKPAIKVLFTSGFPADALSRKNLIVDKAVLINKPYRLSDLSTAIRTALNTAQD